MNRTEHLCFSQVLFSLFFDKIREDGISCIEARLARLILSKENFVNMYIDENDNRTPRERIDDSFLRRMLGENRPESVLPQERERVTERGSLPCNPDANNRRLMNFPLGMVYSPYQEWRNIYDTETALRQGTLFRELDMPWEVPAPTVGKGGRCCD